MGERGREAGEGEGEREGQSGLWGTSQATHTQQSHSHTMDILVYKGSVYIQPQLKLYTGWKGVVRASGSVEEKDFICETPAVLMESFYSQGS